MLLSALSPLLPPLGASPRAILPPRRPRRRGTNLRRAGGRAGRRGLRGGQARAGEDGRPRAGCVSAACRPCARVRGSGRCAPGRAPAVKLRPARSRAGGRGWGRAGPPLAGRSGSWNPARAVPVGGRAGSGGSLLLPWGERVRGLAACCLRPGSSTDRSGRPGSPSPRGHGAVCMRLALALSVWGSCYLGRTREPRADNGVGLALGVASGAGGGGGGRPDGRTGLRLAVQLRGGIDLRGCARETHSSARLQSFFCCCWSFCFCFLRKRESHRHQERARHSDLYRWVHRVRGLSQRGETQELLDGASLRRVCALGSRRGQPSAPGHCLDSPCGGGRGMPPPGYLCVVMGGHSPVLLRPLLYKEFLVPLAPGGSVGLPRGVERRVFKNGG